MKSVIYKPVPMPTEGQLLKLFPRANRDVVRELVGAVDHLDKAGLRENLSRLAMFLVQFGHEAGGLKDLEEDLSYSAPRLMAVWPTRFPNLATAAPFAASPARLAEKVYGGRMGNTQPGDGWRYRGRGMGLTGREAYRAVGKITGYDYEANPDLVAQPFHAVVSACAIWTWKGLNPSADRADLATNTRKLNAGNIGLTARRELFGLAKVVLNVA